MKKTVLVLLLLAGLGSARPARAQAALVNLIATGLRVGVTAAMKAKDGAPPAGTPAALAPAPAPAVRPNRAQLLVQRTPAERLPVKGGEAIRALEAQLDRCHGAWLADSTGTICPPAQLAELRQGAIAVARAHPGWDQQPYQREMAFYLAEDAFRQRTAAPSK